MFISIIGEQLTFLTVLYCSLVSLGMGGILAFLYAFKNEFSKNFVLTLVILPLVVQAVIMMVNGNIGMGVAVAGAFSLVRFRSVPGNSRDITFIFLVMAVGIATGIGQIWFAMMLTITAVIVYIVLRFTKVLGMGDGNPYKVLRITISEEVDYENEIEGVLKESTSFYELIKVKTTNMGSLYTLDYKIRLTKNKSEKELIDELRIRNSNLPIVCQKYIKVADEAL